MWDLEIDLDSCSEEWRPDRDLHAVYIHVLKIVIVDSLIDSSSSNGPHTVSFHRHTTADQRNG